MSFAQKRIAVVLGTRPEFLKLAPVVHELEKFEGQIETNIILTGQHRELLHGLAELLSIEEVIQLPVQNKVPNLAFLTSALVESLDQEFRRVKYDAVIVQGDTTTAFAAALVGFYHRIPVAHVEAGLRTWRMDEPFPEELNRQLISRMARWHFCPTKASKENLLREGIDELNVDVTGNTIIDTLMYVLAHKIPMNYETTLLMDEAPELAQAMAKYRNAGGRTLSFLTLHRRENQGPGLEDFFRVMRSLAAQFPDHHWIYPYHLNPAVREPALRLLSDLPNIHLVAPLSYRPFVYLMSQSDFAMSDSGGVQEEYPSFKKPLLILRAVTERPEAVESGFAKLIGSNAAGVFREATNLIGLAQEGRKPDWFTGEVNPFGDGLAAKHIVGRMTQDLFISELGFETKLQEEGAMI